MNRHDKSLRSQAEPIAVIMLTVVGLAIALMAWGWLNASLGPVSRQALLTEYLALERSREFANLLASGVDAATGYKEYVVELMHTVVTHRKWFAFILLVNNPESDTLVDTVLTEQLNQAIGTNVKVYLLQPFSGSYVRNATPVETITVQPGDVILADGRDLSIFGLNTSIIVIRVPEYYSGVGDPTPQAIIDILVDPALLPDTSRLVLVTLTLYDNKWYEVTRLILP
ncbi:hypothetical protein Pyrfu_0582 [Pyrolobus fumarii 1A]|uniref:Uncharacterized protein n=1 Tax=Pyrolobus fumarii (strain DSM 11204 / 1A) TaxID=694429 RepID=G0EH02_PYRF1|nr:hypothetical protein [Pyrolobus fumarii]AEM38452.1 hypothetical protein Pyrfu_0582 [Pyrolobus fumarii 1A]